MVRYSQNRNDTLLVICRLIHRVSIVNQPSVMSPICLFEGTNKLARPLSKGDGISKPYSAPTSLFNPGISTSNKSLSSLSPLPSPIPQRPPASQHADKQPNTNWMQHPGSHSLRQQTRKERCQSSTTTPQCTHNSQTRYLQPPVHQTTKHRRRAWIDRPK